jgi:hypothetical protein
MNAAYSSRGGLPAYHLDAIAAGQHVNLRHDPCPYSPIHQDDINAQVGAMLAAASVPATIVNWCGDEQVSAQDWCAYFSELTGKAADIRITPVAGSQPGASTDPTARNAITGPCSIGFREGLRRMFEERYPDGVDGGVAGMSNPLS